MSYSAACKLAVKLAAHFNRPTFIVADITGGFDVEQTHPGYDELIKMVTPTDCPHRLLAEYVETTIGNR